MDPGTGRIYNVIPALDLLTKTMHDVTPEEARERGLVPVSRDLTQIELADMQIRLYSPCACGSGKKFKFCCKR